MEFVAISTLRAHLLGFLKKVNQGTEVVVTSRGEEIARILPPQNARAKARKALKALAKKARVEDAVSPIEAEWDALK